MTSLADLLAVFNNCYKAGCNIGSKTFLATWGTLPLKFTCPAGTSTCSAILLNKGELNCPKHYLLSGANEGLVLLARLPFLQKCESFSVASITTGQVVMLHAECHFDSSDILQIYNKLQGNFLNYHGPKHTCQNYLKA